MQQVIDVDGTGLKGDNLGGFYDLYVNDIFYMLAPDYYRQFYSIYLRRCLNAFDGWVNGFHNKGVGLVPQRSLQAISNGLNNMLFGHGIDFTGAKGDYQFIQNWSKRTNFYKTLKLADLYAYAGGTSLIKVNRENGNLYCSTHRIDNYFADIDASGKISRVRVFYDIINKMVKDREVETPLNYGLCEERYFNEENVPCVKSVVYLAGPNLQTSDYERMDYKAHIVNWANLPRDVKRAIKEEHPSVIVDKEIALPFADWLGCVLWYNTDNIPQYPKVPLGQPIGDILFTENFQYDQMKYFEKNEVDLARARALVPEEMWNKDDPDYDSSAMSNRFYQKVTSMSGDTDKITPIQFLLRGEDIRLQKENIFKDMAFKLQVSASSVASFLNEGAGARTATEIVSERTKTDTWIKSRINLNVPSINHLLHKIMMYYNRDDVELIVKAENQAPKLETIKVYSDLFSAGNISAELFVKEAYGSSLSQAEKEREIERLNQTRRQADNIQIGTVQSWQNGGQKTE